MKFIINVLILLVLNGLILWGVDQILFPSLMSITGGAFLFRYGIVAMVFSIINILVRPILMLITTPIRWLTLGVFGLVLNAFLLFAVEHAVNTLQIGSVAMNVNGILGYLVVGVILGLANSVIHWFVR